MMTVRSISFAAATVAAALATLTPASAEAGWNFQTLDGDGGANGRVPGSMNPGTTTVLYNGKPHVFYYDNNGSDLRHAWYTGTEWFFETVDGTAYTNGQYGHTVGHYPSATVFEGKIHVFYWDSDWRLLRHASYNGSSWQRETLDGEMSNYAGAIDDDMGWRSTATTFNGDLYAFYYNATLGNLRAARYNPLWNVWLFSNIDGFNGVNGKIDADVGWAPSAVVAGGVLRVYSFNETTGDLRESRTSDGDTWFASTLDGNSVSGGRINANVGMESTAILWNGDPHVLYADSTNGNLRHASLVNGSWSFETLDGAGGVNGRVNANVGMYPSAVIHENNLHFYYQDLTNGNLRSGYWNGASFSFVTLDGAGGLDGRINTYLGMHSSAVEYNGGPHVFYLDDVAGPNQTSGNLRTAFYTL
jgi:hypothetical protein